MTEYFRKQIVDALLAMADAVETSNAAWARHRRGRSDPQRRRTGVRDRRRDGRRVAGREKRRGRRDRRARPPPTPQGRVGARRLGLRSDETIGAAMTNGPLARSGRVSYV
jgi:hypothetical protein